ncbi:MAG: murein biosynthesis integral membrane protein MurJ [Chloroflexi bacterium]|nr:murein biosynthesis integral membrane protein MurJ [Chloroflexota bacterium]
MESPAVEPVRSANRQIARAAGTVMFAIVLSQLFGLLAKLLTARAFGTGSESEAFFAANRFTEILFNLVAGGALASAFIPTFTTALTRQDRPSAWKLASAVANLILLTLTLISALAAIFAPQVVRYVLAPGFAADPAKIALTAMLLRIQLISPVIFGLSGLVMGILNAHQSFLFPALAPSMYSLGWCVGVLWLAPGMGIAGLAWGVVLGASLHLLLQIPALLCLPGRSYSPTLGMHLPGVREVARLMGPRLVGVAVVQLNFLLNTYLASLQPEGSLTGISLAFPLMYMPLAAIAQSVATAALPTFSTQAASGKPEELRTSLAASLRGVLLLAVPASLGLMLLRRPLVVLLYQHGEFTSISTELVAWALLWYAAGLVSFSMVEIVSRAFYALHDTKTPVIMLIIAMSLNLGFSLLFSAWFNRIGWMPHGGLALANSLATTLEMIGLLVLMRRRLKGLEGRSLLQGTGQAFLAALGMGVVLALWLRYAPFSSNAILALGGVVLGGLVYSGLLALQGVHELRRVWGMRRAILRRVIPVRK